MTNANKNIEKWRSDIISTLYKIEVNGKPYFHGFPSTETLGLIFKSFGKFNFFGDGPWYANFGGKSIQR